MMQSLDSKSNTQKARTLSNNSYMEPNLAKAHEVPRDEREFTDHGPAPRGYEPAPFQG
ncbi:MAG: hypothetical protein HS101_00090 [Planctomycetia bacterium]|nr:hypothetical protein [Planctomycetia bacterium]MCC7313429.1 hypothetical protein [Planctomycetota bacterium]